MLKRAFFETTSSKINELIVNGKYKYLSFINYEDLEPIKLAKDEWNNLEYVSVGSDGEILGYFSAKTYLHQKRIQSCMFVKFRYKFKDYKKPDQELEKIVNEDFDEFSDMIFNHPICDKVSLCSVVDNKANKTYEKWMRKYNGSRFMEKDYCFLKDGKRYSIYNYWFDRDHNKIKVAILDDSTSIKTEEE